MSPKIRLGNTLRIRHLIAVCVILGTHFLAIPGYSAPGECRITVVRTCASGGACTDEEIALCEPDVRVIVEKPEPPPYFQTMFSRGVPVPRVGPGGGAHYRFRSKEGRTSVCSLPTHGHNGFVNRLSMPIEEVTDAATGRTTKTHLAGISIGSDKPWVRGVTGDAVGVLNRELAARHIALRFRVVEPGFGRPLTEVVSGRVSGAAAMTLNQTAIGQLAGEFASLFAGTTGARAVTIITPTSGVDTVAHELLHAVGLLDHNLYPNALDTEAGRMASFSDPTNGLSGCEAGVLAGLYGYDGSGYVVAPAP